MRAIVDWVHDIRTPASLLKVSLGELEAKGIFRKKASIIWMSREEC